MSNRKLLAWNINILCLQSKYSRLRSIEMESLDDKGQNIRFGVTILIDVIKVIYSTSNVDGSNVTLMTLFLFINVLVHLITTNCRQWYQIGLRVISYLEIITSYLQGSPLLGLQFWKAIFHSKYLDLGSVMLPHFTHELCCSTKPIYSFIV